MRFVKKGIALEQNDTQIALELCISRVLKACNWGRIWSFGFEATEALRSKLRVDEMPPHRRFNYGYVLAEAAARSGDAKAASDGARLVLDSPRKWDVDPYFEGIALKLLGEVLRVSGHLPEAATVARVAVGLHDNQPFFRDACEDLLQLIAEEMDPDDFEQATQAATDLKASDAVQITRTALGE
ncbi:MAG: hypothetical protein R6V19_02410 [Armatimonadota bacterium]